MFLFWRTVLAFTIALAVSAPMPTASTASAEPSPDRLFQQGMQRYAANQLEAAIHIWQRVRLVYQRQHNRAGERAALENLGAAYVKLEHYRPAIAALEACLQLTGLDAVREARVRSNLGLAYQALGNYPQAIQLHRQAGKLLYAAGDRQALGQVLSNLGNAFAALGDDTNALIAYRQSLKLAQQTHDSVGTSTALNNLGFVHLNLGQYDRAFTFFEESLRLNRTIANRAGQASTLLNIGSTYHALNAIAKAQTFYQQALVIARAIGDRQRESEALSSLGLVLEDLNQFPQAIAHHEQSLAMARARDDPAAQSRALNNLGHALFGAGKLVEAEAAVQAAAKLLDELRIGLSDRDSISLFDTQLNTYNLLQQIRVAAHKPEAALEAAEQGRARSLAQLLARQHPIPHSPESATASGAVPATRIAAPSVAEIRDIARHQRATLVEYTIVPDADFKFRGKQRAKEVGLFIWVVQPSGKITLRQVKLPDRSDRRGAATSPAPSGLTALVSQTRQAIRGLGIVASQSSAANSSLGFAPEPSAVAAQLQQLHRVLIAPIADLLPSQPTEEVVFIPQEALLLVPFAALQSAQGTYLIEQHTIRVAPAIQVLALARPPLARRLAAPLVVGNPTMPIVALAPDAAPTQLVPLPGAEQEARQVAQLLHSQALIGQQATETIVKQKLATASWVHLATHGLLDYATSARPGSQTNRIPGAIALAPSASDDGLLTSEELLTLHLQAEMVVLSACDTGQGTITGDGVVGLSRSLMAAGAANVLVSLWSVPDAATAQLMRAFYQNLPSAAAPQRASSYAAALRLAMLATLKDHPNPIDWAAFVLMGSAAP